MDIVIVNYNRLAYLQKCIWSILASSDAKIHVVDDGSTDGSKEWLSDMANRSKIESCVWNNGKGTAQNFNDGIKLCKGDWFVIANEDMWFHREWEGECNKIKDKYFDCGIVSFYDYTRLKLDPGVQNLGDCFRVIRTGLGACMINRNLYDKIGGFNLPKGKRMGYFASKFCELAQKTSMMRKGIYNTKIHYASNMDIQGSLLEEFKYIDTNGYRTLREKEKNFKSERKWYK